MHQLKLFDLSSVGMAVKIPAGLESLIIAKNYILQDVTLRLGTKQVVTEAVVFAVKKTEQGTIWVLLLAPQTSARCQDAWLSRLPRSNAWASSIASRWSAARSSRMNILFSRHALPCG